MISIVGTDDYECVQKLTKQLGGIRTGRGDFWRVDLASEWEEYSLLHTDWTSQFAELLDPFGSADVQDFEKVNWSGIRRANDGAEGRRTARQVTRPDMQRRIT